MRRGDPKLVARYEELVRRIRVLRKCRAFWALYVVKRGRRVLVARFFLRGDAMIVKRLLTRHRRFRQKWYYRKAGQLVIERT